MRQALEAATKAYEAVKKSVQEKWEGFKSKFEGAKTEASQEVMNAKTPEDLIALGKKLQQQGEDLKAEEEALKQEEGIETDKEAEMNAAEDEADYQESVKEQESADIDKMIEIDRLQVEKEAQDQAEHEEYVKQSTAEDERRIAELREKLGQNMEQVEPLSSEQTEKISEAKNVLMQLFDKAGWRGFSELMVKSENILDGLGDNEQEQLAQEFFNETIGKSIINNKGAYQVYGEFKGTAFAKKFAELEDSRLKRAGYTGFIL